MVSKTINTSEIIFICTTQGQSLISTCEYMDHSQLRYPVWLHTFVSPSAFSRRAVVSYWRKFVHEVLFNRLGGLCLPGKSVVKLTDHPDMTLDVYRGRKTTIQQQQQRSYVVWTDPEASSVTTRTLTMRVDENTGLNVR